MNLSEIQTAINSRITQSGDVTKPIWEIMGDLASCVQDIDERTRGGLPKDETIEILKAKIVSLNSLLDYNAGIFDKIKAILGAPNATAAELPVIISNVLKRINS